MPKTLKRIHSVTIKRTVDDSPDTSYLGEYSSHADSDYSIDREHDTDCASQSYNKPSKETTEQLERINDYLCKQFNEYIPLEDDDPSDWYNNGTNFIAEHIDNLENECNCSGGSRGHNEYRYFNPNVSNYEGETHEDKVKYCIQDYNRMESLNAGSWCFIGIVADATIGIGTDYATMQHITSGGLWGVESDSDANYLAEVEQEQLSKLREQLHAIGFSHRAISAAFKNVERKED
jgi:hypothetical protein